MAGVSGKKVAVVATDYFEETELTQPVKALREAGSTVEIINDQDGNLITNRNPDDLPTFNAALIAPLG